MNGSHTDLPIWLKTCPFFPAAVPDIHPWAAPGSANMGFTRSWTLSRFLLVLPSNLHTGPVTSTWHKDSLYYAEVYLPKNTELSPGNTTSRRSQRFHLSQWLFTPSNRKWCLVFPLKKPEFSFQPLGLIMAFSAILRNWLCRSTLCFLPNRLSCFKFLTVRYININPPQKHKR